MSALLKLINIKHLSSVKLETYVLQKVLGGQGAVLIAPDFFTQSTLVSGVSTAVAVA